MNQPYDPMYPSLHRIHQTHFKPHKYFTVADCRLLIIIEGQNSQMIEAWKINIYLIVQNCEPHVMLNSTVCCIASTVRTALNSACNAHYRLLYGRDARFVFVYFTFNMTCGFCVCWNQSRVLLPSFVRVQLSSARVLFTSCNHSILYLLNNWKCAQLRRVLLITMNQCSHNSGGLWCTISFVGGNALLQVDYDVIQIIFNCLHSIHNSSHSHWVFLSCSEGQSGSFWWWLTKKSHFQNYILRFTTEKNPISKRHYRR